MTLPLTRDTTFATDTPIKAVSLNEFQDAIIGAKHGRITYQFPAQSFRVTNSTSFNQDAGGNSGSYWSGGGQCGLITSWPVGTVLEEFTLYWQDDGTDRLGFQLYEVETVGGTSANLFDLESSGSSGIKANTFDSSDDGDIPYTTKAGWQSWFIIDFNTFNDADHRFYHLEVVAYRP